MLARDGAVVNTDKNTKVEWNEFMRGTYGADERELG